MTLKNYGVSLFRICWLSCNTCEYEVEGNSIQSIIKMLTFSAVAAFFQSGAKFWQCPHLLTEAMSLNKAR